MKKKLALLFAVALGMSGIVATTANAISINIDIGDQPYYIHGPGYWVGRVYWVWVPGHWDGWRHGHRVWIRGHYAPR
jgi:predicted membrane channel-forming protein YqfA (hemolysin III family)